MKKKNLYKSSLVAIVALLIGASCNPLDNVDAPDFNVTTERQTYKVGDTVTFKINGNPDHILFYSGESGNDYTYANTDRILQARAELSFQTQVRTQSGPNNYCQEDQFHILMTNDLEFTGATAADSIASLNSATWREVTNMFTICELECLSTTAYQYSGVVDITDLFEDGKTMHFAFQYKNKPYATHGNGNIWRFSGFAMNAITDAGTTSIAAQNTANWQPIYIGQGWEGTTGRFTNTGTIVTMRGPSTNDYEQELWAVSTGIDFGDVNLGYDVAVGIKTTNEIPLEQYKHIFSKAGVYTVTFIAKNSNIYDSKQVLKQIEITITD